MTSNKIHARLLVAVMAIVACLALAPVTARAAQTSSWSITSIAAFGGGFPSAGGDQQAAPGGEGMPSAPTGDQQAAPGGEGMPAAPGQEGAAQGDTTAEAAAEEEESESAFQVIKDTIKQYVEYAKIHPVRVYGSIAALVIGLIFAFAFRKRA